MCVGTINALDPTCPRTCVAFVTVLLSEAIKVCSITFGMAAEPSDESKWLKSHYEEAATGDVPTPSKRVKYQTLKDDIELHFPHRTYNDLVVKGFIKEAFPMSSTKRLGKLRHTHVLGIETKPGDSHTSAASLEDVVQLQRRAELAEKRLCEAAEENKMLFPKAAHSPVPLHGQLQILCILYRPRVCVTTP